MTRAARLAREIADGEQALAVKKAEYAKLKGSAAPEIGARASESSQQAGPVKTQVTPAEVAKAAANTNTTVTAETEVKNGVKTEKVSAAPFSPTGLRDGAATREFGGIKFGIGLAYTLDLGKYQRVREAELVNNIVRIKQSEQSSARIVLESH